MKNPSLLFPVLIILTLSNFCFAQSASAGLSLNFGLPQGEFKENVDRVGFGIGGHLVWIPSESTPFSVGLNVGYLIYGSESRRERFSLTIPDVTVEVDRSNNLLNFHLLFQVSPQIGTLRPYIEGLFGGAYLFTETKINQENLNYEIASSTNFSDYAWNYGGGGGLLIYIFKGDKENNTESFSEVFLDIKARYLFGSTAEYLKEGSAVISDGKVYYNPSKSKTDLLFIQLGLVAYF